MKPKSTRLWALLIGVIAVACIIAMVVISAHRETGGEVTVYRNGELADTFPLNEDREVRYELENGDYNIVAIKDGEVSVTEASCPDQVCVRHGPTDQTADPIVCLPNSLVVEVVSPDSQQLDGVTS